MPQVSEIGWRERWQNGRTPWDLFGPHPATETLLNKAKSLGLLKETGRVFSPGCGHAHDAAWLAKQGYEVHASDIAPEAIATAKATHGEIPGLRLMVEDVFAPGGETGFDLIFDRAVLCAFEEKGQADYLRGCAERLRSGGVFLSIPFLEVQFEDPEQKGPPFAISEEQLFALMQENFELAHAVTNFEPPLSDVIKLELLSLWIRK